MTSAFDASTWATGGEDGTPPADVPQRRLEATEPPPEPPATEDEQRRLDDADALRRALYLREELRVALIGARRKLNKLRVFTEAAQAEMERLEAFAVEQGYVAGGEPDGVER